MKIQENVTLRNFTTFKIGGDARYFCVVKTEDDLREAFSFAKSRKLPLFVLGGGSNLLISDNGFPGIIVKNEIKGIKFTESRAQTGEDTGAVSVEVGSGEALDDVVNLSVSRNLYGLENLSGIPGTVGGAAVQNAGAYGTELSDVLLLVQGLNSANGKKFVFEIHDCQYGYRKSIFKQKGKYVITAVTIKLSKQQIINNKHLGLKNILDEKNIKNCGEIRQIILETRNAKLPDWSKVGTAGSYFKNPIISEKKFCELKEKYPDITGFPEKGNKTKVSLAWILDKICKLNGYREGDAGLYEKQPLVLINYGHATEKEIRNLSEKIKNIVKGKTGIEIEEEVERVN